MARMRTLKIGFFANDTLAELPPVTRLLFAGLWLIADREGKLENRPKRIKAEILPYDDCDISASLSELEKRGFIETYEVEGAAIIKITNFLKHQVPNQREAKSVLPDRPKNASTLLHVQENASTCADSARIPLTGTGTGTEQEQEQEPNHTGAQARACDASPFDCAESAEGDEATLVDALTSVFPQLQSLHRKMQEQLRECVSLCVRLKVTPEKIPKWRAWLTGKWRLANANPEKFIETLNQFLQEENSDGSNQGHRKDSRTGNTNGIPQHDAGRYDAEEF